ncbi:hypothetical protein HPB49_008718 [Dermacentor silvarum]|uniref:Uncharacterized protein n=1 Tax=Dermacentor silvarum TaxID=543639 RepID=A0ACB8C2Q5_DERSI|nr:hypothetical protein HPB49_008718 [Dermacentor silvarum]
MGPMDDGIKSFVLNEHKAHSARRQGDNNCVVVHSSAYTVTCTDLKTVLHRNWLNDVVIDFYMGLVAERAKEARDGTRVHVLTTHFYNELKKLGYAAELLDGHGRPVCFRPATRAHQQRPLVTRCSEYEKPIVRALRFVGTKDWNCYQVLMAYLKKEHQDKQKCPPTPEVKWQCQYIRNLPQQCNS